MKRDTIPKWAAELAEEMREAEVVPPNAVSLQQIVDSTPGLQHTDRAKIRADLRKKVNDGVLLVKQVGKSKYYYPAEDGKKR